jgi:predicted dehydrogenase
MIKIGLIGTGFIGNMHALVYESLKGKAEFEVTAVADDNPEKAQSVAEKFGATAYRTAAELIEQADVNTVDICLPTYLHKDVALHAMNKGYHVFIEKPVCLNDAEADELLAAQRRTNANVMVGHCIRFWPEYVELKKRIDDNRYGRIVSASFRRLSPKPRWGWQQWMDDPAKSGTASLDLHIHDVDFVRYILGEPDRVKSEAVYRNGSDSHIFSVHKYGNVVVSLEGGWDFPDPFPFEMGYRVRFERAVVDFNSNASPALVVYEDAGERIEIKLGEDRGVSGASGGNISSLGGYYNELLYFLECLNVGKPIGIATLEDGVNSVRLALREIEAAK